MKFLCVECDEAMKLGRTLPPEQGTLAVIFSCPTCGRETALLTNAMETQLVRSLGVKIGGRSGSPEPMEMARHSLLESHGGQSPPDGITASPSPHPPAGGASESRCPFAGVVADAFVPPVGDILWTEGAEARMARIPAFAQPMVRKGVEIHAREHGYTEINEAVLEEAKARFAM